MSEPTPAITTTKALNLARDLMLASDQFMAALEKMLTAKAEQERSGIVFTADDVEAGLAADGSLQHIKGDMLNSVITSANATHEWLDANFHSDNFQKVRP